MQKLKKQTSKEDRRLLSAEEAEKGLGVIRCC